MEQQNVKIYKSGGGKKAVQHLQTETFVEDVQRTDTEQNEMGEEISLQRVQYAIKHIHQ